MKHWFLKHEFIAFIINKVGLILKIIKFVLNLLYSQAKRQLVLEQDELINLKSKESSSKTTLPHLPIRALNIFSSSILLLFVHFQAFPEKSF